MTHAKKLCLLLLCCMLISSMQSFAQKKDTSALKNNRRSIKKDSALVNSDTVVKLKFRPQVATRRAAILPGWGQATNKEYWKIPIAVSYTHLRAHET